MTTLVCFALKEEAAPFRKMAAGTVAAAQAASILITGIGCQSASQSRKCFVADKFKTLVTITVMQKETELQLLSNIQFYGSM